MWHVNRFIVPNEKLKVEYKSPVGDFHLHNGQWILINRKIDGMRDIITNTDIKIGDHVELNEGKQILLSPENGGRLIVVQMVDN